MPGHRLQHLAPVRALRQQDLAGAGETRFGKCSVLAYLPKKIANFLYEFRAADFPSLILPILPSDCSRLNIHAMLRLLFIAACCGGFRNDTKCTNIEQHVVRNNISLFCRFGLPSNATGASGCSELSSELGHTKYPGPRTRGSSAQPSISAAVLAICNQNFYGDSRENFVFVCPQGVELFVLSPENAWYGRLRLLSRSCLSLLSNWQIDG